ncbi:MAG: hypothetical protein HQK76_02560 [Desulfobacterales bacterium]|nr:hypothetical protein [Desulfobacterales bacterium]
MKNGFTNKKKEIISMRKKIYVLSVNLLLFIFLFIMFYFPITKASAETIRLTYAEQGSGGRSYFFELLETALTYSDQSIKLEHLGVMPQNRIYQMLIDDRLSLNWLLQSKERDTIFTPVEVDLTNGLIGHRILLIPKGRQSIYQNVKTLDDFKKLNKVGGFGQNWFDVAVWKYNQLPYIEVQGAWQVIYNMLNAENRGIDYFSRGIFEILPEAKKHPYLDIESHLVFVYQRDFRFYLSKNAAHLKKSLEEVLLIAKNNGLMEKLIQKHWKNDLDALGFNQRVKLILNTPE